jgi:hypothetical protein
MVSITYLIKWAINLLVFLDINFYVCKEENKKITLNYYQHIKYNNNINILIEGDNVN